MGLRFAFNAFPECRSMRMYRLPLSRIQGLGSVCTRGPFADVLLSLGIFGRLRLGSNHRRLEATSASVASGSVADSCYS